MKPVTFYYKTTAALLACLIGIEAVAVPLSEAAQLDTLWTERQAKARLHPSAQLASLPSSFASQLPLPSALLESSRVLPSALAGLEGKFPSSQRAGSLRSIAAAIPGNRASLRQLHVSEKSGAPTVVILQDVHLNFEAQANIAAVLRGLGGIEGIQSIGVEGAFGAFDMSPFRDLKNHALRDELAEAFMKENLIGAPAFSAITLPSFPALVGVDDKAHYDANVSAYLTSEKDRPAVAAGLRRLEPQVGRLKARLLSSDLQRFEALRDRYHRHDISLGAYVQKLSTFGVELSFEAQKFLQAFEMEGALDFRRVESERQTVIGSLAARLRPEDVTALLESSLSYRNGQIGFGPYYRYLKNVCERYGVRLHDTREFETYIKYVLLSDAIDSEALFTGLEKSEAAIQRLLSATPEQARLLALCERLKLVDKLISFELTPQEWSAYAAMATNLSAPNVARETPELADVEATVKALPLKSFENFYREADKRTDLMLQNLFAKAWGSGAPKSNSRVAALVVGGFHVPSLVDRLRRSGASYLVVGPKLTKISDGPAAGYLTEFSREKTSLERLLTGEKLFLNPSFLSWGNRGNEKALAPAAQYLGMYEGLQTPGIEHAPVRVAVALGRTVRFWVSRSFPGRKEGLKQIELSSGPVYLWNGFSTFFIAAARVKEFMLNAVFTTRRLAWSLAFLVGFPILLNVGRAAEKGGASSAGLEGNVVWWTLAIFSVAALLLIGAFRRRIGAAQIMRRWFARRPASRAPLYSFSNVRGPEELERRTLMDAKLFILAPTRFEGPDGILREHDDVIAGAVPSNADLTKPLRVNLGNVSGLDDNSLLRVSVISTPTDPNQPQHEIAGTVWETYKDLMARHDLELDPNAGPLAVAVQFMNAQGDKAAPQMFSKAQAGEVDSVDSAPNLMTLNSVQLLTGKPDLTKAPGAPLFDPAQRPGVTAIGFQFPNYGSEFDYRIEEFANVGGHFVSRGALSMRPAPSDFRTGEYDIAAPQEPVYFAFEIIAPKTGEPVFPPDVDTSVGPIAIFHTDAVDILPLDSHTFAPVKIVNPLTGASELRTDIVAASIPEGFAGFTLRAQDFSAPDGSLVRIQLTDKNNNPLSAVVLQSPNNVANFSGVNEFVPEGAAGVSFQVIGLNGQRVAVTGVITADFTVAAEGNAQAQDARQLAPTKILNSSTGALELRPDIVATAIPAGFGGLTLRAQDFTAPPGSLVRVQFTDKNNIPISAVSLQSPSNFADFVGVKEFVPEGATGVSFQVIGLNGQRVTVAGVITADFTVAAESNAQTQDARQLAPAKILNSSTGALELRPDIVATAIPAGFGGLTLRAQDFTAPPGSLVRVQFTDKNNIPISAVSLQSPSNFADFVGVKEFVPEGATGVSFQVIGLNGQRVTVAGVITADFTVAAESNAQTQDARQLAPAKILNSSTGALELRPDIVATAIPAGFGGLTLRAQDFTAPPGSLVRVQFTDKNNIPISAVSLQSPSNFADFVGVKEFVPEGATGVSFQVIGLNGQRVTVAGVITADFTVAAESNAQAQDARQLAPAKILNSSTGALELRPDIVATAIPAGFGGLTLRAQDFTAPPGSLVRVQFTDKNNIPISAVSLQSPSNFADFVGVKEFVPEGATGVSFQVIGLNGQRVTVAGVITADFTAVAAANAQTQDARQLAPAKILNSSTGALELRPDIVATAIPAGFGGLTFHAQDFYAPDGSTVRIQFTDKNNIPISAVSLQSPSNFADFVGVKEFVPEGATGVSFQLIGLNGQRVAVTGVITADFTVAAEGNAQAQDARQLAPTKILNSSTGALELRPDIVATAIPAGFGGLTLRAQDFTAPPGSLVRVQFTDKNNIPISAVSLQSPSNFADFVGVKEFVPEGATGVSFQVIGLNGQRVTVAGVITADFTVAAESNAQAQDARQLAPAKILNSSTGALELRPDIVATVIPAGFGGLTFHAQDFYAPDGSTVRIQFTDKNDNSISAVVLQSPVNFANFARVDERVPAGATGVAVQVIGPRGEHVPVAGVVAADFTRASAADAQPQNARQLTPIAIPNPGTGAVELRRDIVATPLLLGFEGFVFHAQDFSAPAGSFVVIQFSNKNNVPISIVPGQSLDNFANFAAVKERMPPGATGVSFQVIGPHGERIAVTGKITADFTLRAASDAQAQRVFQPSASRPFDFSLVPFLSLDPFGLTIVIVTEIHDAYFYDENTGQQASGYIVMHNEFYIGPIHGFPVKFANVLIHHRPYIVPKRPWEPSEFQKHMWAVVDRLKDLNNLIDILQFQITPPPFYMIEPVDRTPLFPFSEAGTSIIDLDRETYNAEAWSDNKKRFELMVPPEAESVRLKTLGFPVGTFQDADRIEILFNLPWNDLDLADEVRMRVRLYLIDAEGFIHAVDPFIYDGSKNIFLTGQELSRVRDVVVDIAPDAASPGKFPPAVLGAQLRVRRRIAGLPVKPENIGPPNEEKAEEAPAAPDDKRLEEINKALQAPAPIRMAPDTSVVFVEDIASKAPLVLFTTASIAAGLIAMYYLLRFTSEDEDDNGRPRLEVPPRNPQDPSGDRRAIPPAPEPVRPAPAVPALARPESPTNPVAPEKSSLEAVPPESLGRRFAGRRELSPADRKRWYLFGRSRDGVEFLRSDEGRRWLSSDQGLAWLLETKQGRRWFETSWGLSWRRSAEGQRWLTKHLGFFNPAPEMGVGFFFTHAGFNIINSKYGLSWLEESEGRAYALTEGWSVFLLSDRGAAWLNDPIGVAWLASERSDDWRESKRFSRMLASPVALTFLATKAWRVFLDSAAGVKWLASEDGITWLIGPDSKKWVQSPEGIEWLQSDLTSLFRSPAGREWVRTYLKDLPGKEWYLRKQNDVPRWFTETTWFDFLLAILGREVLGAALNQEFIEKRVVAPAAEQRATRELRTLRRILWGTFALGVAAAATALASWLRVAAFIGASVAILWMVAIYSIPGGEPQLSVGKLPVRPRKILTVALSAAVFTAADAGFIFQSSVMFMILQFLLVAILTGVGLLLAVDRPRSASFLRSATGFLLRERRPLALGFIISILLSLTLSAATGRAAQWAAQAKLLNNGQAAVVQGNNEGHDADQIGRDANDGADMKTKRRIVGPDKTAPPFVPFAISDAREPKGPPDGAESATLKEARKNWIAAEARLTAVEHLIYEKLDGVGLDPVTGEIREEMKFTSNGLQISVRDPKTETIVSQRTEPFMPLILFEVDLNDREREFLRTGKLADVDIDVKMQANGVNHHVGGKDAPGAERRYTPEELGYYQFDLKTGRAWVDSADVRARAIRDMRFWDDATKTLGSRVLLSPSAGSERAHNVQELGYLSLLLSVTGGAIEADPNPEFIGFLNLQFNLAAMIKQAGRMAHMRLRIRMDQVPVFRRVNLGTLVLRAERLDDPRMRRLVETLIKEMFPAAMDPYDARYGGRYHAMRREALTDAFLNGRPAAEWREDYPVLLHMKDAMANLTIKTEELRARRARLEAELKDGRRGAENELENVDRDLSRTLYAWREIRFNYREAREFMIFFSRERAPSEVADLYWENAGGTDVIFLAGKRGWSQGIDELKKLNDAIGALAPKDPAAAKLRQKLEESRTRLIDVMRDVQRRNLHAVDRAQDAEGKPAVAPKVTHYERILLDEPEKLEELLAYYENARREHSTDARDSFANEFSRVLETHSWGHEAVFFGVPSARQRYYDALIAERERRLAEERRYQKRAPDTLGAEAEAVARKGGVRRGAPTKGAMGSQGPLLPPGLENSLEKSDALFRTGVRDNADFRWYRVQPAEAAPYLVIVHRLGWRVAELRGMDIRIDGKPLADLDLDDEARGGVTPASVLTGRFILRRFHRMPVLGKSGPEIYAEDLIPLGEQKIPFADFLEKINAHVGKDLRVAQSTRVTFAREGVVDVQAGARRRSDKFIVPSWATPDAVLKEQVLGPGHIIRFPGSAILNPFHGRLVPPRIEVVKDDKTREEWTIVLNPKNPSLPLIDGAGRITYQKNMISQIDGHEEILQTFFATYDEGFLYSVESPAQRDVTFYDVERTKRLYYDWGAVFDTRSQTFMRADLEKKRADGSAIEPVVYDTDLKIVDGELVDGVESALLVGAVPYSKGVNDAPLPHGINKLIDKFKVTSPKGTNPRWVVVRSSQRDASATTPWGAELFPGDEIEDHLGVTVVHSRMMRDARGAIVTGSELGRTHFPKMLDGSFRLEDGRLSPAETRIPPSEVGERRFPRGPAVVSHVEGKEVLAQGAFVGPLAHASWDNRGTVVTGTLDKYGRVAVRIEDRFGWSAVAIPRIVHQDIWGRSALEENTLSPSPEGPMGAWLVTSAEKPMWDSAEQRWIDGLSRSLAPQVARVNPRHADTFLEPGYLDVARSEDPQLLATHPNMPDDAFGGALMERNVSILNPPTGIAVNQQKQILDANGVISSIESGIPGTTVRSAVFFPQEEVKLHGNPGTAVTLNIGANAKDVSDSIFVGITVKTEGERNLTVTFSDGKKRLTVDADGQVKFISAADSMAYPLYVRQPDKRVVLPAVVPMQGRTRSIDTPQGSNLLIILVADLRAAGLDVSNLREFRVENGGADMAGVSDLRRFRFADGAGANGERVATPLTSPAKVTRNSRGQTIIQYGSDDKRVTDVWVYGQLHSRSYYEKENEQTRLVTMLFLPTPDPTMIRPYAIIDHPTQWMGATIFDASNPDAAVLQRVGNGYKGVQIDVYPYSDFPLDAKGQPVAEGRFKLFSPYAVFDRDIPLWAYQTVPARSMATNAFNAMLRSLGFETPELRRYMGKEIRVAGLPVDERIAQIRKLPIVHPHMRLTPAPELGAEPPPAREIALATQRDIYKAVLARSLPHETETNGEKKLSVDRLPPTQSGYFVRDLATPDRLARLLSAVFESGSSEEARALFDRLWELLDGGKRAALNSYKMGTPENPTAYEEQQNSEYNVRGPAERRLTGQLDIADAALRYAAKTGDTRGIVLFNRMLEHALSFRTIVGGQRIGGFVRWAPGESVPINSPWTGDRIATLYSIPDGFDAGDNALVYLRLKNFIHALSSVSDRSPQAKANIEPVLTELNHIADIQAAWLEENIFKRHHDGVLAARLREHRDTRGVGQVFKETRDYRIVEELTTNAQTSLLLILAGNEMKMDRAELRRFLEITQIIHGVQVQTTRGPVFGLTWVPASGQPDALSVQDTALLLIAARACDDPRLVALATRALNTIPLVSSNGDGFGLFPEVAGIDANGVPLSGLDTGNGFHVYPSLRHHVDADVPLLLQTSDKNVSELPRFWDGNMYVTLLTLRALGDEGGRFDAPVDVSDALVRAFETQPVALNEPKSAVSIVKDQLTNLNGFSLIVAIVSGFWIAVFVWSMFTKIVYWFKAQLLGHYSRWKEIPEIEEKLRATGADRDEFMQTAIENFARDVFGAMQWTGQEDEIEVAKRLSDEKRLKRYLISFVNNSEGFTGTAEIGWLSNAFVTYLLAEALYRIPPLPEDDAPAPDPKLVARALVNVQRFFARKISTDVINAHDNFGNMEEVEIGTYADLEFYLGEIREHMRFVMEDRVRHLMSPEARRRFPVRRSWTNWVLGRVPATPDLRDEMDRLGLRSSGDGAYHVDIMAFEAAFDQWQRKEPLSSKGYLSLNPMVTLAMRNYFQVIMTLLLIAFLHSAWMGGADPLFQVIPGNLAALSAFMGKWLFAGGIVFAAFFVWLGRGASNDSGMLQLSRWMGGLSLALAFFSLFLLPVGPLDVGILMFTLGGMVGAEAIVRLRWNQSLLGLSFRYLFQPTALMGGLRSILTFHIHLIASTGISTLMGLVVWNWYSQWYSKATPLGFLVGVAMLVVTVLIHVVIENALTKNMPRWGIFNTAGQADARRRGQEGLARIAQLRRDRGTPGPQETRDRIDAAIRAQRSKLPWPEYLSLLPVVEYRFLFTKYLPLIGVGLELLASHWGYSTEVRLLMGAVIFIVTILLNRYAVWVLMTGVATGWLTMIDWFLEPVNPARPRPFVPRVLMISFRVAVGYGMWLILHPILFSETPSLVLQIARWSLLAFVATAALYAAIMAAGASWDLLCRNWKWLGRYFGPTPMKDDEHVAITLASLDPLASPVFSGPAPKSVADGTAIVMERWKIMRQNGGDNGAEIYGFVKSNRELFEAIGNEPGMAYRDQPLFLKNGQIHPWKLDEIVTRMLNFLHKEELGSKIPLWNIQRQLLKVEPRFERFAMRGHASYSDEEKKILSTAFIVRRWVIEAMSGAGAQSYDTAVSLMDFVETWKNNKDSGKSFGLKIYLPVGFGPKKPQTDPELARKTIGEIRTPSQEDAMRDVLMAMVNEITGEDTMVASKDLLAIISKSGGMNSVLAMLLRTLKGLWDKAAYMHVWDRNTSTLEPDKMWNDLYKATRDTRIVGVFSRRRSTLLIDAASGIASAGEQGMTFYQDGVLTITPKDQLGAGWGFLQKLWPDLPKRLVKDPRYPSKPVTLRLRESGRYTLWERWFGSIGASPNQPFQSEDYGASLIADRALLDLGLVPLRRRSSAEYGKSREAANILAFPAAHLRWSGGLFQLLRDNFLRVNYIFGSGSPYVKEGRAQGENFYLLVMLSWSMVVLMSLFIREDWTPFVGINAPFYLFGILANQILTIHAYWGAVGDRGLFLGTAYFIRTMFRNPTLFAPHTEIMVDGGANALSMKLYFDFSTSVAADKALTDRVDEVAELAFKNKERRSIAIIYWDMIISGAVFLSFYLYSMAGLGILNVVLLFLTLMFISGRFIGPKAHDNLQGQEHRWHWTSKWIAWIGAGLFFLSLSAAISVAPSAHWVARGIVWGMMALYIIFKMIPRFFNQADDKPETELKELKNRGINLLRPASLFFVFAVSMIGVLSDYGVLAMTIPAWILAGLWIAARRIDVGRSLDLTSPPSTNKRDDRNNWLEQKIVALGGRVRHPVPVDYRARFPRLTVFAEGVRKWLSRWGGFEETRTRYVTDLARTFSLANNVIVWIAVVPIAGLLAITVSDYLATIELRTLFISVMYGVALLAAVMAAERVALLGRRFYKNILEREILIMMGVAEFPPRGTLARAYYGALGIRPNARMETESAFSTQIHALLIATKVSGGTGSMRTSFDRLYKAWTLLRNHEPHGTTPGRRTLVSRPFVLFSLALLILPFSPGVSQAADYTVHGVVVGAGAVIAMFAVGIVLLLRRLPKNSSGPTGPGRFRRAALVIFVALFLTFPVFVYRSYLERKQNADGQVVHVIEENRREPEIVGKPEEKSVEPVKPREEKPIDRGPRDDQEIKNAVVIHDNDTLAQAVILSHGGALALDKQPRLATSAVLYASHADVSDETRKEFVARDVDAVDLKIEMGATRARTWTVLVMEFASGGHVGRLEFVRKPGREWPDRESVVPIQLSGGAVVFRIRSAWFESQKLDLNKMVGVTIYTGETRATGFSQALRFEKHYTNPKKDNPQDVSDWDVMSVGSGSIAKGGLKPVTVTAQTVRLAEPPKRRAPKRPGEVKNIGKIPMRERYAGNVARGRVTILTPEERSSMAESDAVRAIVRIKTDDRVEGARILVHVTGADDVAGYERIVTYRKGQWEMEPMSGEPKTKWLVDLKKFVNERPPVVRESEKDGIAEVSLTIPMDDIREETSIWGRKGQRPDSILILFSHPTRTIDPDSIQVQLLSAGPGAKLTMHRRLEDEINALSQLPMDRQRALLKIFVAEPSRLGVGEQVEAGRRTGLAIGDLSEAVTQSLPPDAYQARVRFGVAVRRAMTGEAESGLEMGSQGSIYDEAAARGRVETVVHYLDASLADEDIDRRITFALARTNFQLAFVLPDGRDRLVSTLAVNDGLRKAVQDGRVLLLRRAEAETLSQFLKTYDDRSATDQASRPAFRFFFPSAMSLDAFVDIESLPADRYRFYVAITGAMNAVAVEVRGRQMERDNLTALLERIASQA